MSKEEFMVNLFSILKHIGLHNESLNSLNSLGIATMSRTHGLVTVLCIMYNAFRDLSSI